MTNQTIATNRPQIPKPFRYAPVLALAALSAASAATPIRYTCTDGRVVTATYPDQTTAILTFAGQTITLTRRYGHGETAPATPPPPGNGWPKACTTPPWPLWPPEKQ